MNRYTRKISDTSLMHSGPSKEGFPIAGVTGYHAYKIHTNFRYIQHSHNSNSKTFVLELSPDPSLHMV